MQIPKEILAEKNYEGSRLIEIKNDKVYELHKELEAIQKEINPSLDRMTAEYSPLVEPLDAEIREHTKKIKELKEKIAEHNEAFTKEMETIEKGEQKAQLIKNKIQPLVREEIDSQLGEFEIARHTQVIDGKIYVEVFDEIEEKVKQLRASKMVKSTNNK